MTQLPDTFWRAWFFPATRERAIKVCLVVGTILIAINQGDLIARSEWPPLWKIMLTYLVPYSVSSFASASFILDYARRETPKNNCLEIPK